MGNTVYSIFRNLMGKANCDRDVPTEKKYNEEIIPPVPVYSWDRQPIKDADMLTIQNVSQQKMNRSLKTELVGQQMNIQNCSDGFVSVPSYSNSIFIDDCKNCKIIVGPVKCSIFLRNCHQCLLVASCGQLRTRDCSDLTLFLHCCSQPSIESSSLISFNCISLNYDEYAEQLTAAGLDRSVNLWCRVFDFTPLSELPPLSSEPDANRNWRLLSVEDRLEDFLSHDELLYCSE